MAGSHVNKKNSIDPLIRENDKDLNFSYFIKAKTEQVRYSRGERGANSQIARAPEGPALPTGSLSPLEYRACSAFPFFPVDFRAIDKLLAVYNSPSMDHII